MWNVEFINILNIREPRPATNRALQLRHGSCVTLSHHLDASVRQIADPASDGEGLGLPGDVPPEPDALHAAGYHEADRNPFVGHPAPLVRFLTLRM